MSDPEPATGDFPSTDRKAQPTGNRSRFNCPEHGPQQAIHTRGPSDRQLSCGCRVTTIQAGEGGDV